MDQYVYRDTPWLENMALRQWSRSVHVSAVPPSVVLIKAAERLACFVSLYFVWMLQPVGWGVVREEEEEQLNWTGRRKAWVPLPATHLTSSCLIISLHKIYTFTVCPSIGQWGTQLYTFKVSAEDRLSVSLLACPFIHLSSFIFLSASFFPPLSPSIPTPSNPPSFLPSLPFFFFSSGPRA